MEYLRSLGATGMKVKLAFCLGTMMFGAWGNQDHDEASSSIINTAVEAGINFIDTADKLYSRGKR